MHSFKEIGNGASPEIFFKALGFKHSEFPSSLLKPFITAFMLSTSAFVNITKQNFLSLSNIQTRLKYLPSNVIQETSKQVKNDFLCSNR